MSLEEFQKAMAVVRQCVDELYTDWEYAEELESDGEDEGDWEKHDIGKIQRRTCEDHFKVFCEELSKALPYHARLELLKTWLAPTD